MNLIHEILKTINYYNMLMKGDTVLVAVSGGPDSVFLLHILVLLKRQLGVTLSVAHLDHGLRGKESRQDVKFVRNLAKKMKLKFISKTIAHPDRAQVHKLSLEERLREKRYNFFKKAAKKLGANVVATAHTLDDQAETVLMRLLKGTSLKGLVGIHGVRFERGIKFIRPLIEIEKKNIIKYLRLKKIPFRIDRTNLENKFLRNKIRNKILPYLAKVNPRIKRTLFNLAESLREDFEFIEEEKKRRAHIIKKEKSMISIHLRDILLQPKALQKEVVREAIKSVNGNIKRLTFRHWKEIDNFLRTKAKGKSIDLPGRVKIKKTSDRLIFARQYDII